HYKVLFIETECLVVSPDFKMPNENQILLKVLRQNNMYSFDMKTLGLTKDYACLIVKATSDESKLWHKRLDQAVDQPSPSKPLPSSSHPPVLSATTESEPTPVAEQITYPTSLTLEPNSEPIEHAFEQPSPEHQPLLPRQETEVPQSQDPTHPYVAEERTMTIEDVLKRRHVVLPDSEDKDAEISSKQGRNLQEEGLDEMVWNMMKDKSEVFKTPTQGKTSGEEDISLTTLKVAKTLSKVASQRSKSVDKGKRYKRRKESKGKDIDTGFKDISNGFEDISTGFKDISTGFKDISTSFEEVNTGGLGVSTGSGPVSSARGQREGKAPMIVEETQTPKRTKEQIQQEEASLTEVITLQTLEEEETAKQVHLDALLAKRLAEKEEAKLEANAELTKDVLGKDLSEQDFAKRMLKKLKFEEIKEEFEKLVKKIDTFVPINIKATKAQLKRYGEEFQTKISKKQRIDDKIMFSEQKKKLMIEKQAGVKNQCCGFMCAEEIVHCSCEVLVMIFSKALDAAISSSDALKSCDVEYQESCSYKTVYHVACRIIPKIMSNILWKLK
ncbi:hypothetical protein Tco_0689723, partial [Tanacetum coccineum]